MRMPRKLVLLPTLLLAFGGLASGQIAAPAPVPGQNAPLLLDRVVAIVNGDVLLQSDVEEEARFAAFQPFSEHTRGDPQKEALDRLIDRSLIEQQMRGQAAMPAITDAQLDKELTQLRKDLPACARYACRTDAGWKTFCSLQGFTEDEVSEHWRTRMALLAFIEQRFRTGIRISQSDIAAYYTREFVPRFKERNLNAPSLDSVSSRIQEILLQQKVNVLLGEWLNSLRDQGSVQILDPALAGSPSNRSSGLDSAASQ